MAMIKDTDRPLSSLPAVTEKIMNANFASLSGFGGVSTADYNNLLSDAKLLAKYCAAQTPAPTSFIERLKLEHKELVARLVKLDEYIVKGAPGAGDVQRELLHLQLPVMKTLLQILDLRLSKIGLQEIADERAVASKPAVGEPVMVGGHDIDRDGPVPFGG